MSRLHPYFRPREWLSWLSRISISIASVIIFFFMDIMDVIMCHCFRVIDHFLEGKASSCYCIQAKPKPSKSSDSIEHFIDDEEENELSQSLHRRRNVFRSMGLVSAFHRSHTDKEESAFHVGQKNRWSDCGCESCVSWMNSGGELKLHVEVKEPEIDRFAFNSRESTVQNVIFIHGFLSSSSLWKETVFKNLHSEHAKQRCKLFAVDLLGFGRSPKPSDCLYTLKDHLRAIEESLIVPHEMDSFHVVAHSMGCIIALTLAAKNANSVKSITLVAPPYFSSANGDNASLVALEKLATRKIWPPLVFGSAFMSWYEHLGRCVCFFVCRFHKAWEWILKKLTRKSDLHFGITDITRHTHHSAWHTMHNIVCGGARLSDKYLNALCPARVKTCVIHGTEDSVVPLECSYDMKLRYPEIELEIIDSADHSTVILGREKEFTSKLETLWDQSACSKKILQSM